MKQFILTICLSLSALMLKAQDMATLFTSIPDQKIPQLENAWRKDLIDLYNSGKEARLKNNMNGFSVLRKLTADYLLIETTERSQVEMKLLPLINNTHIICMITTVDGPVADSRVEFFTTEWEPLVAEDMLASLSRKDFLKETNHPEDPDLQYALSRLDMELIHYQLNPDDLTLTATYTTPQYLNKEDREKVEPFLRASSITLRWEKYHFR